MHAETCDVAIVGAGPAGFTAARRLADAGQRVIVLDEQPRLGGQILRQPPAAFAVERWLAGRSYARLKASLKAAEADPRIDWRTGTVVWGAFRLPDAPGYDVRCVHGTRAYRLVARRLVVATGAYELPVPFPGWQLPGVLSAGGMQTLLKGQQLAPGGRVVLAGTHPLQLVLAEQLLDAGVEIARVAFAQPARRALALATRPAALLAGVAPLLDAARVLARLARHGVRLEFGTRLVRALGHDAIEAVELAGSDRAARVERVACDALATCFGFLPSTELARQAGAAAHWAGAQGGWVIRTDGAGRSSAPDLYVAGEQTGIRGAPAAVAAGEIVATALLADAGLALDARAVRAARRRWQRHAVFAAALDDFATVPDAALTALPDEDTLVCRCEEVRYGTLCAALDANPLVRTASAAKLLTRVGMGPCQGRICEPTVHRMLAARHATVPGAYVPRAPIKPVPAAVLAAEVGSERLDAYEIERRHGCDAPRGHYQEPTPP
jgi:D-hydroxyproline dehydrogenase subunit alpha